MTWTPERIDLPTVANLRDLGGAGGVVRPGTLLRSTHLADASAQDRRALTGLGIATVVDLRTAGEIRDAPDRDIAAREIQLDVLRDSPMASSASMDDLFSDPAPFATILQDGTAVALMREAYLAMVDLPSARQCYGDWLRELALGSGPVLVHCTNGKDRTGWAVAIALLAVGVDIQDVLTDYLTTNEQYLPRLAPVLDKVAASGMDPDLLLPVLGVREEYLQTALDRVSSLGSFDDYLAGLGVTDSHREGLRRRLT